MALAGRRTRVDEGVVVALEGEQAAAVGNDAVQDGRVQERALVGDDLADPVAARRPQHGQIPGRNLGSMLVPCVAAIDKTPAEEGDDQRDHGPDGDGPHPPKQSSSGHVCLPGEEATGVGFDATPSPLRITRKILQPR